MADGTKIEWTDATWNPITGCSVLSAGCKRCYAMKLAGTRMKHHPSRAGLTIPTKAGPVWTGEVRFNEGWLRQPLSWAKPRMIFVNAHGDTFHENVPDAWIDRIFAIAGLAEQHVFQVLTKRSRRMRDYLNDPATPGRVEEAAFEMRGCSGKDGERLFPRPGFRGWPLPNVWAGVSVEDQDNAHRLNDLIEADAKVRWISAEPLLGPLDIAPWLEWIDWVVAGGESDKGPGARPMHQLWAESLLDQCEAASVPFLFKQWGDWHPFTAADLMARADAGLPALDRQLVFERPARREGLALDMWRIGKGEAGRLLRGRTHDGLPA